MKYLVNIASAPGGLARIGIYSPTPTGGYPGAVLLDAGTVALDAVAVVEIVIAVTLTRGEYYIAHVQDAAATIATVTHNEITRSAHVGLGTSCGVITNLMVNRQNGRQAEVAGGLTDPYPGAITRVSINNIMVWLRKA